MNSQYTLAPKQETSLDSDEIISQLSEYLALLRPVTILNYYRELPLTSTSSLHRIDYSKFEVTVSEIHLEAIRQQLQTIICLEWCTALAECSELDDQKNSVIVSDFRFIELHAEKRQAFRLNVEADLIVDFRNSKGTIAAKMVDISVSGCRIRLESGDMLKDTVVVLEINIFDQQKKRELSRNIAAIVVNTFSIDDVNYCGLKFLGTPSDKDLLSRYVNQKQASIIRKLRKTKTPS